MAISRRIRSQYSGTCRACGKPYDIGDEILWTKGQKAVHVLCPDAPKSVPSGRSQMDGDMPIFTEDWEQLKSAFLSINDGNSKSVFSLSGNSRLADTFQSRWKNSDGGWFGASLSDMKDWLANGFRTDAFHDLSAAITPVKRRRIKFSDEGEFQFDLMRSGADYPFLEWEKRESKPGLSFDVLMMFSAGTDSGVISDYSKWIAKTLYSLETEGYDLEVALRYDGKDVGSNYGTKGIRIVVKRENEATDFTQWSALFSPAAFRMLGFTAIIQAADHFGVVANAGLGMGLNTSEGWRVEWNADARAMKIVCPYMPRSFPAEDMDRQVRDALNSAR